MRSRQQHTRGRQEGIHVCCPSFASCVLLRTCCSITATSATFRTNAMAALLSPAFSLPQLLSGNVAGRNSVSLGPYLAPAAVRGGKLVRKDGSELQGIPQRCGAQVSER